MSVPLKSSSPPFNPIRGLSSPFRDSLVSSLSSPSHVIDISPSPPPPAMRSLDGRFEDALLPQTMQEAEPEVLEKTRNVKPQLKSLPVARASHQTIGLGLGIQTDGGTLESFMGATQATTIAVHESRESVFKSSQFSRISLKGPSLRRIRINQLRSRYRSFRPTRAHEDHGYLAEDEGDDDQHGEEGPDEEEVKHDNAPEDYSWIRNYEGKLFDSVLQKRTTVSPPASIFNSASVLLASTNGPRRVPSKKLVVDHEDTIELSAQERDLPQNGGSPSPSETNKMARVLSVVIKRSPDEDLIKGSLRYSISARGVDEPESTTMTSNLSGESGLIKNGTSSSPSTTSSILYPSATPMIVSSPTFMPMVSNVDMPLLLPSSPALAVHSPTLREAPGSFSPSLRDTSSFPPSALYTPQTNDAPMGHGTGPLIFSILAGSMGFFGIFAILLALFWKKNSHCSGFPSWKRKPRGTAYDEFMEEDKGWWVGENMAHKGSKKSACDGVVTSILRKDEKDCVGSQATMVKFARSESQAPSIPPIAHIVNGKISIDSIRIDLPSRSSTPVSMRSVTSKSCGEERNIEKFGILPWDIQARKFDSDPTALPDFYKTGVDSDHVNRSRSGSKSSDLSKASKKSISSIASFLLNKTKLEAFNSVKKKPLVDLGISSEDYKLHFAESDDVESSDKPLPKSAEIASIGLFNHPSKLVDDEGVLIRRASIHSDKMMHSSELFQAKTRPTTLILTPPSILITDHPSELIPPSPPRPPISTYRPVSVGTILTRYSAASYSSENNPMNDRYSFSSRFSASPFSMASAHEAVRDSFLPHEAMFSKRIPSTDSQRTLDCAQITSLSNLLSHRARLSGGIASPTVDSQICSQVQYCAPERSSLSSIASSKTITELAAVTEDLRALIDSDVSGDCSWHSPSQFHISVPDRAPVSTCTNATPPMRPPKSANRYLPKERLSIEYESTSTPSSPIDSSEIHLTQTAIGCIDSITSDWSLDVIQTPSKPYNLSQRPAHGVCANVQNPRRPKSGSGSSLETVISAESNASLFEVASLHTAQTIRGASAEFVVRAPTPTSPFQGSRLMMAIMEEIDSEFQD